MPTSTLFYVSYVALWLLLLAIGVLLLLLYRHFGVMSLGTLEGVQRDGLPVGAAAPPMGGVTAAGEEAGWEPRRGALDLLLFVSPDCGPCETLLPVVNRLAADPAVGRLRVTAIAPGPRETIARLDDKYRPTYRSFAEDGSGAFARFRVRVTPFAFVVGADGRVLAKGLCGDPERLRALLEAAGADDAAGAVGAAVAAAATDPMPMRAVAPVAAPVHLVRRGVGNDLGVANGIGNGNGNGKGRGQGIGAGEVGR